jgi:hypothetical protein
MLNGGHSTDQIRKAFKALQTCCPSLQRTTNKQDVARKATSLLGYLESFDDNKTYGDFPKAVRYIAKGSGYVEL